MKSVGWHRCHYGVPLSFPPSPRQCSALLLSSPPCCASFRPLPERTAVMCPEGYEGGLMRNDVPMLRSPMKHDEPAFRRRCGVRSSHHNRKTQRAVACDLDLGPYPEERQEYMEKANSNIRVRVCAARKIMQHSSPFQSLLCLLCKRLLAKVQQLFLLKKNREGMKTVARAKIRHYRQMGGA
jgi:hypothetical protein